MPLDDQKELFIVVDENDKIIGYRTRSECHNDKSLIHRGIGVVVFNTEGKILLQKRSKQKDLFPGYYSISTGGHVTKGETYLQGAKRELFEEIGVKTRVQLKTKFIIRSERETEIDTIYSAIYNGSFKLDNSEVERVEFFSPFQIKKMMQKLTPFAIKSLKALNVL